MKERKNKDKDLKIIAATLLLLAAGFIYRALNKYNIGDYEFAIFGFLSAVTFLFIGFYIIIRTFVTRKRHNAEIKEAHRYDDLTGLLNRLAFQEEVEKKAIKLKDTEGRKRLYYLTIGIDRFRYINETFGHKYADQILIDISKNLKEVMDEDDIIGRLEGDGFSIVTQRNEEEISQVVKNISKQFNKIYQPENFNDDVYVSAKMGVSAWSRVLDELSEDVVMKSKFALDVAKQQGGAFYKMYNKTLERENNQNLELEKDLREAVLNNEIDVFFQPKIGTDGKVKSAEALARWYSEKRQQMINPGVFIEMAEELNLIEDVGKQIMEKSIKEMKKWHNLGYRDMRVAVNVSTKQFNRELPFFIKDVLNKYQMKPSMLEVEVTESALVNDKNTGTDLLVRIKDTGATIAIDDFGTGYSSLSYLLEFPLDVVKIDKSFIDKLEDSNLDKRNKGEAVVSTVINLSHRLGCKVVAEGVENKEQLDFLRKENCDLIQGYYYSRPLNKKDFIEYLKEHY